MMKERNQNIQVLRCIACMMVFFSHIVGLSVVEPTICGINLNTSPLRLLWGGNAAVVVFFFLSGYFYKCEKEFTIKNYLNDIVKRHRRIYPAFVIVLFLGIFARMICPPFDSSLLSEWGASFWMDSPSLLDYAKNFILLLPVSNTRIIDPAIWTLKIDMRVMMVLPFVEFIEKKIDYRLFTAIIIIGCFFVDAFAYLPVFVIGSVLSNRLKKNELEDDNRLKVACLVLGILLLSVEYLRILPGTKLGSYVTEILTAVGASFIVIFCERARQGNGSVYGYMVWFGNISYYFYLVHLVVILFFRFLLAYTSLGIYAVIVFSLSLVLAIGLASLDKRIQTLFQSEKKWGTLI